MKIMFYLAKIIMLIMTMLVIILNLTSKKTFHDREKNSPFECGFDPKTSSRMPFSLQFFLIAVIFISFVVELTLLLPMTISMSTTMLIYFTITSSIFILILSLGLYHEWKQGALAWAF